MNTCVTKKENLWVVVFFRFFESGSFLSLSLFFSFLLFVPLSVNGAEFRVLFFIWFAIQKVPISRRVHQFSVLKMVSFYNTINYLTTQMNNEISFKNTTTKGLL